MGFDLSQILGGYPKEIIWMEKWPRLFEQKVRAKYGVCKICKIQNAKYAQNLQNMGSGLSC
jgi:hypothetical protein